jgi:hypothetical protein
MSKILVALWSYDSHAHYGEAAADVLRKLKNNLTRCRIELASMSTSRRPTTVQAIFVAAEYLFTAPGVHTREPMSSSEKNVIEKSLRDLSRHNPNTLIFSGTVFYQEKVSGSVRHKMRGGLISNELEVKKAYVKAFRQNENLSVLQIAKVDIQTDLNTGKVVWASLTDQRKREFCDFHGRLYGWEDLGTKVPGLLDLAKGFKQAESAKHHQRRARNCTYVLLGGQRIGKYDKHSDFKETRGAAPDQLAFLPGTTDQAPEADGLRFGVEICFDHGNGVLKRRGLGDLDFHVVVSDWVHTEEANMAMKRGGYFLHASSEPTQTKVVFRASNGSLTPVTLSPVPSRNALSFCTIDTPPQ